MKLSLDEFRNWRSKRITMLGMSGVGKTRDRMREYKQALGSLILHPRVLAAAVAYTSSS